MKRIFAILLIMSLVFSACGAKETETSGADSTPKEGSALMQPGTLPADYSEQDSLFPPTDHPPYVETDGQGGEWMSAWGVARSEAVSKDRYAFWDYMEKHQDSPLAAHLAGAYTGDITTDWALVICLDEPENKALLDEIAGIGLRTDYRIEKGVGTKAYLDKCLPEIIEKLSALNEKVKSGKATDEEKELIQRYKPKQPSVVYDMGKIWIEVSIKTPWYSIGEDWSEEDMNRDLDRCRELFYKLIGYEDVVGFAYPV